jgi:hypothetical protein
MGRNPAVGKTSHDDDPSSSSGVPSPLSRKRDDTRSLEPSTASNQDARSKNVISDVTSQVISSKDSPNDLRTFDDNGLPSKNARTLVDENEIPTGNKAPPIGHGLDSIGKIAGKSPGSHSDSPSYDNFVEDDGSARTQDDHQGRADSRHEQDDPEDKNEESSSLTVKVGEALHDESPRSKDELTSDLNQMEIGKNMLVNPTATGATNRDEKSSDTTDSVTGTYSKSSYATNPSSREYLDGDFEAGEKDDRRGEGKSATEVKGRTSEGKQNFPSNPEKKSNSDLQPFLGLDTSQDERLSNDVEQNSRYQHERDEELEREAGRSSNGGQQKPRYQHELDEELGGASDGLKVIGRPVRDKSEYDERTPSDKSASLGSLSQDSKKYGLNDDANSEKLVKSRPQSSEVGYYISASAANHLIPAKLQIKSREWCLDMDFRPVHRRALDCMKICGHWEDLIYIGRAM